ncbi:MAG: hypothetical protein E7288_02685 [Lachnospiraceae bacterium]|nr:hypothetical protein [Lachnospiraceae bacterium]
MGTNKVHKQNIQVKEKGKFLTILSKYKMHIAAFLIPIAVMTVLYAIRHVYPFGDRSYMRMDFYHQYAPFMKEFARKLKEGDSLFYAFDNGLGVNYWAHYAYYLASPLNWIYRFVPNDMVVEVMNFTMVFRSGVAGLAFFLFLSKRYLKENWMMVAFSLFYGASSYYLAYSCNIIWNDCYALFPLVVLGVEELVRGKSGKWYAIAMGICAISNFYLAVIVGFCLICYLPIAFCAQKGITFREIVIALARFAAITVLYVSVAAVIMLPVYLALQHTPSGNSTFPQELTSNFSILEVLERLLINMPSVLNKSKLPNIYSSVFFLLAFPMFLSVKSIPWKEKLVTAFMLVFLLLSFQLNILDYIWHGLHFPNSFPARQAFFFIFLAISVMYQVYEKRQECSVKVLCIVGVAEAVLLAVAWIFAGKEMEYKGTHVYLVSIVLLLIYLFLLFIELKDIKNRAKTAKVWFWFLAGVCLLEVCVNTFVTGINSTVSKNNYEKNDAVIAKIVREKEEDEAGAFFRMEEISRKTVNDAAWNDYNGVSYFSSTIRDDLAEFYKQFGLRYSNGSVSYAGATPFVGSLFGVKYVINDEDVLPGVRYTKEEYTAGNNTLYCYTNEQALPLGFLVDSYLDEQFQFPVERNPFLVHNEFAKALLGTNDKLFVEASVYEKYYLGQNEDFAEGAEDAMNDSEELSTLAFEVPAEESPCMFIKNADSVNVTERNLISGEEKTYEVDDLEYRKILSFGVTSYPREICVTPSDDETKSLNALVYFMSQQVLDQIYDVLAANPMQIKEMSDTKILALIESPKTATVFTSIPYEEGWSVFADGEEVQVYAWKDAFLAFEVGPGTHELEFTYMPPGFKEGLIISVIGLLVSGILLFSGKKTLKKKKALKK